MRSDNLMRHIESKHDKSKVDLTDAAEMDQDLYYSKVEGGQQLFKLIESGKVDEISLSTQNDKALKLYMKHRRAIDVENAKLRPWQENALIELSRPTDREVIWIRGQHGNEGKTWFQAYVQSLYGFQNVACLDMKCRANDSLLLARKSHGTQWSSLETPIDILKICKPCTIWCLLFAQSAHAYFCL